MAKKTADRRTAPPRRTRTRRTAAAANEAPAGSRQPTFDEIAEAAYHRYLKRGGSNGTDFDDWVEAGRELRTRSPRKT